MTNKPRNFKIKNIVLILLSVVFIFYGIGAIIILNSGATISSVFHGEGVRGFFRNNFNGHGDSINIDQNESISLKDISKISVSTSFSDVKVMYNEESDLKVALRGNTRGMMSNNDMELNVNSSNGEVIIKEISNNGMHNNGMHMNFSDVKLLLYIPKDYSKAIDISTVSGDMDLSQVDLNTTDMNLNSISGDIEANNINTKNIGITSKSGSVDINKLISSSLKSSQISGEININYFEGAMEVETTSGDIEIKSNKIDGPSKINSISGEVDLYINPNLNLSFDINSVSGDVSVENSLNTSGVINKSKGSIKINSGGTAYTVSTTSGDIEIKAN
ncbi:DUF4097 family beta strand repeat-containing protein [Clostridium sp.]|uniref:DUF4097 family beta strand repeat-containing protein n=1 Tax=Clostridium sp. TaxID=1506 RepID=UPI003464D3EB